LRNPRFGAPARECKRRRFERVTDDELDEAHNLSLTSPA
jgi:hypothetical protein